MGKVAIVTGATSGIGKAVVELLLKEKINVVALGRDYEKIEAIFKTVDSLKGKIHIISSKHEPGKKLNGLTGIAALLRYKF